MEKENRKLWIIIPLILLAFACEQDHFQGTDEGSSDDHSGILIFDFGLPERRVPVEHIHRIDLSIAKDAESLYKGYFIVCANVSDLVRKYSFELAAGEYYYQAGITCSSEGDTCLWDGFPGGQFGSKWTAGKIEVVQDEPVIKVLQFLD